MALSTSPAGTSLVHLANDRTSLVFAHDGGMPRLVHWGQALGQLSPDAAAMWDRPAPRGGLDIDPPLGLVAQAGDGWFGTPGIDGHRPGGRDFAPRFSMAAIQADVHRAVFEMIDSDAGLGLELTVELHDSGVATFAAALINQGSTRYLLSALRISLTVPSQACELMTIGGRWTNEFGLTRTPWVRNCLTVDNRHGKTSHERLGAVFAGTAGFSEQSGEVWGVHLGWSGNYEFTCDAVTDARRSIQVGELLIAGEIALSPGDRYSTPVTYAAYSSDGLTNVSQAFHRFMRARPNHPTSPRPVGLNIWEAVYFNHDLDTLRRLADVSAAVGVERFIIDDGWFHLRRDDTAGLGDWWVDPEAWPNGLEPIIDHVRGLGMEFGIWVEPEMVNPDSDLYRAHPEWILADHRYPLVMGRNQLVLDLGRSEVREYLFGYLTALLGDHDIAYVKWDMNRDMVAPSTASGHGGVHAQTLGVYELFDRLRAAHPGVEFETCASGGGRVDFAIFERTERAWTSDSIDALDRQNIQRGFSLLFPPELMGTHIGSPVCHTTGRTHNLAFRAAAALFGSFGIEWNLLKASERDLADVTAVVALHKELRGLLHSGDVVRLDHPDPEILAHGVVATDRSNAVYAITRINTAASLHASPVRLVGLDPTRSYDVRVLEPMGPVRGPARSQPGWLTAGARLTGQELAGGGLHGPVLNPETTLLIRVTAAS